jgi:hypothetical protein
VHVLESTALFTLNGRELARTGYASYPGARVQKNFGRTWQADPYAGILDGFGRFLPTSLTVVVAVEHHRRYCGPAPRRPCPGFGSEVPRWDFAFLQYGGAFKPFTVKEANRTRQAVFIGE